MLETVLICASLAVVDGDTVKCDGQLVRLIGSGTPFVSGFDTAEIRGPECDHEREMAFRAKKRLEELISGAEVLDTAKRDRFGRILGRLRLSDGRLAGDVLLAEGLAQHWPGSSWCDQRNAPIQGSRNRSPEGGSFSGRNRPRAEGHKPCYLETDIDCEGWTTVRDVALAPFMLAGALGVLASVSCLLILIYMIARKVIDPSSLVRKAAPKSAPIKGTEFDAPKVTRINSKRRAHLARAAQHAEKHNQRRAALSRARALAQNYPRKKAGQEGQNDE